MPSATELHGWEAVLPFITECEPPPVLWDHWVADGPGPSGWVDVVRRTDDPVSHKTIGSAFGLHPTRNLEIARLWAAAHDLYDALEDLLNYDGGADHGLADVYVVDRARNALARARGEPLAANEAA